MAGPTAAPVGGTVTSGVNMNRDNVTFPDAEQTRRLQARQESEWAAGDRPDHPSFVTRFQVQDGARVDTLPGTES